MKTRSLLIALSGFVAAVGLISLLGALFTDLGSPLRHLGFVCNGALLLIAAVALLRQSRIAAPLLAASAFLYGVLGIYELLLKVGLAGFGQAGIEYYGSLALRMAVALAAYFLVVRASRDHAPLHR
jgi:hypothetical protein